MSLAISLLVIWSTGVDVGAQCLITVRNVLRQCYIFTAVCDSVHRRGWRTPPRADNPLPWTDTPLGRHPLGRHPSDRHPPGQTPAWACWDTHTPPPSACWNTHPPPAATVADGTHPTGMHSCLDTKINRSRYRNRAFETFRTHG